jgi:hypothetical protein
VGCGDDLATCGTGKRALDGIETVRFIVANYGTRHAGMLLAHLHSVQRAQADAAISVYWQDMPAEILAALERVAPRAEFIRTEYDFDRDPLQRISSKVVCWARAAEENMTESRLVFCDSDTLARRSLDSFFETLDWDVVLTSKPERVPLNSGVVLARGGERSGAFFRRWRDETLEILQTPELFAQANDPAEPYGGTDQMSLYRMLPYRDAVDGYTVDCDGQTARVRMEQCARLNEINSGPLQEQTHVVHYKGGWQRILLDGRPFSRFRPRAKSWEMLEFFLETFSDALAVVNANAARRYTAEDFGIKWPWYYDRGEFNRPAYAAWRVKEAAKRAWLLATGRLKTGM